MAGGADEEGQAAGAVVEGSAMVDVRGLTAVDSVETRLSPAELRAQVCPRRGRTVRLARVRVSRQVQQGGQEKPGCCPESGPGGDLRDLRGRQKEAKTGRGAAETVLR